MRLKAVVRPLAVALSAPCTSAGPFIYFMHLQEKPPRSTQEPRQTVCASRQQDQVQPCRLPSSWCSLSVSVSPSGGTFALAYYRGKTIQQYNSNIQELFLKKKKQIYQSFSHWQTDLSCRRSTLLGAKPCWSELLRRAIVNVFRFLFDSHSIALCVNYS